MINYKLIDLRIEFTIGEVVQLWFDIDPYEEKTSSRTLGTDLVAFEKLLREAIRNGTCKNRIDNSHNWMAGGSLQYRIDRQSLIEFANHINQQPAFLFPDSRTLPQHFGTEKQESPQKIVPFPTPSGTQWHEIKISVVDNDNVSINIREKIERRNYAEMGFKNQKNGKSVKSWQFLLAFRKKERLTFSQENRDTVEKSIQDLRKRLRAYFRIQDDPIDYEGGYKPKFKIFDYESQSRSVYAIPNSDLFNEKEED